MSRHVERKRRGVGAVDTHRDAFGGVGRYFLNLSAIALTVGPRLDVGVGIVQTPMRRKRGCCESACN